MNTLLVIGGWAHPTASLELLAQLLRKWFTVSLLSPHAFSPDYAKSLQRYLARERPVILLGWSWGGLLALASVFADPACAKILILVASTARFCRATNYVCGVPPPKLRAMKMGLRKARADTLRLFFERGFAPIQPDSMVLDRLVEEALQWNDRELINALDALEAMDFRGQLEALTIPTLIIHGVHDAIIPFAAAQFLAHRIPRAVFLPISDGGHNLPLTHAQLLSEKISVFAREQSL